MFREDKTKICGVEEPVNLQTVRAGKSGAEDSNRVYRWLQNGLSELKLTYYNVLLFICFWVVRSDYRCFVVGWVHGAL